MATPGSMKTKFWRKANSARYREYMRAYMAKRRAKDVPNPENGIPVENGPVLVKRD